MRKLVILSMLIASLSVACKKEYSGAIKAADNTSRIEVVIDDESISTNYEPNKPNRFVAYQFGGVAGNYFGFSSIFDIDDKSSISVTLGTILTPNSSLSEEEIMSLINPGEKKYGSLGAFTTYPQLKPGCAEIAYTDKKGIRWSSTQITERNTQYGVETDVSIHQHDGKFVIDKAKAVSINTDETGYRIDGHFDCFVYEVNGKKKKRMKGDFSGVIGNEG